MSQPLIAELARQDPAGTVDILAPGWTAGLCQRLPGIGEVIASPFSHGELNLTQRWALAKQIAQHPYRQAYVLPNSFKSALIPWMAGIPRRIGYVGEWRYGLLNTSYRLNKALRPRLVDRYFDLAQSTLPTSPHPRIQSRKETVPGLKARLQLEHDSNGVIVLCPGAEYGPAKRWPSRHFSAIAQHYLSRHYAVWIMGSVKDFEVGEEIRHLNAHQAVNLCGKTQLADAIDLMDCAAAVITNDSGLMHVAAALGRPTIAVFGSSSAAFTPPLSEHARTVSLSLSCSPCFKRWCPLGHMDCLEHLMPEAVLAELTLLQNTIQRSGQPPTI